MNSYEEAKEALREMKFAHSAGVLNVPITLEWDMEREGVTVHLSNDNSLCKVLVGKDVLEATQAYSTLKKLSMESFDNNNQIVYRVIMSLVYELARLNTRRRIHNLFDYDIAGVGTVRFNQLEEIQNAEV